MYAGGETWQSWMKDFKYGTLVFIPESNLRSIVDSLRMEYDPMSAHTSMAHITLTQPFSKVPSMGEIEYITKIIFSVGLLEVVVGPATTSPNKRLLWLDIESKGPILTLRENLHNTGLFRIDLPLTKGFIPHMTISESGREPEAVQAINNVLNEKYKPWKTSLSSVAWIIPDENFVFKVHRSFDLKPNKL